MTKQEVYEKYNIPMELLNKYERIFKRTYYNDDDLEKLSMIMTLYDIGFNDEEAEHYINLYLSDKDTAKERTAMLTKKRESTLDDIHSKQKQLDSIDYLRYKILNDK